MWLVLYLLKASAPFIIGFAAGCALCIYVNRRHKKRNVDVPPALSDLDNETIVLEREIKNTERQVDDLLYNAGFNREFIVASHMKRPVRFKPGRERDEGNASGGDADAEAYVDSLKQRLSDVRLQVTHETGRINSVSASLSRDRKRRQEGSGTSAAKTTKGGGQGVEESTGTGRSTAEEFGINSSIIKRRDEQEHHEEEQQDYRDWADINQTPAESTLSGGDWEFVELYNRAVTDLSAREQFRERYQPVRLGTINAVERRQNPTIAAEYRETSNGDFLAFPIPGKNEYKVFPSLGLTIESVGYTAGALGVVFGNTQGYDPQHFYSRYRVREPAIFKCDGDRWTLDKQGELELGQCD